jgi:hypothetical protein
MSSLEVVLEGPRGRAEVLDRYVEFVASDRTSTDLMAEAYDHPYL